MVTGRLLVARALRLMARRRRLLACWLLLLPLLSLALLPPDSDRPWLPRQLLSCARPRLSTPTDLDTELVWPTLRLQANTTNTKQLWSDKLEIQYKKVKINPPFPLKIMLVPHCHREHDWRRPLTELYRTVGRATLDALVKVMPELPDMTFTWSEVSQLHLWWYGASAESRRVLAGLIRSGRLEVTSGSWVAPEDTIVRLHTLVEQLVQGHQWLRRHVGVTPKTGLCTGLPGAGCSSALAYLFSQAGITQAIVTSAPRAWTDFLASRRSIDFRWQQQAEGGAPETLLTHVHPVDGPPDASYCGVTDETPALCSSTDLGQSLLEADGYNDLFTDVTNSTVKERADALVAAAGRVASLTAHNVALVMVPTEFHPANTSAWRERHRSLAGLSRYINDHSGFLAATAEVATPAQYFAAVRQRAAAPLARLSGDLHGGGAAEQTQSRWRLAARQLETRLRSTELLLVWAMGVYQRQSPSDNDRVLAQAFKKVVDSRRTVALLSRRGATAGGVTRSLARELTATNKTLQLVVHLLWSVLLLDLGRFSTATEAAKHFISLQRELGTAPKLVNVSVQPEDTHQLVVYNSLPFERSEVIQFATSTPNIAVQDSNGVDVPLELSTSSKDTLVVKFLASRLAPVSMTTYRVSGTDLGSMADPAITFDEARSDLGEAFTISNDRFELKLTESPHSWLLVDRRTADELPLEIQLISLRPAGGGGPVGVPLTCPSEGWSRHVDSVTAEALLRCGKLRLTLGLTQTSSATGQAVRLLVESESESDSDRYGGMSDTRGGVFDAFHLGREMFGESRDIPSGDSGIFGGRNGEEAELRPLLLRLRTPVRSQTGSGGFFTDSADYQMVRRAAAELPAGLRPATVQASLQDDRWRLSLLLEQTRSVASPAEGELAVQLGAAGRPVDAELLLAAERLPTGSADSRELFANSPLVALLSQQLTNQVWPLLSRSGSPVRLRSTPRMLDGPLPCDYELVSLRQLESDVAGRPAARALLTLSRRRLDCRLGDSRDELGCELGQPLPALSALVGAERLRASSLTGREEPEAPPLDGLQEVNLEVNQIRSFLVTLDRQLPLPPTEPQEPGKNKNRPFIRPSKFEGNLQYEVGKSYQLHL